MSHACFSNSKVNQVRHRFSFKESTCFFFSTDDKLILDSNEFLLHVMTKMQILDETRHIDPTCYRRKIS